MRRAVVLIWLPLAASACGSTDRAPGDGGVGGSDAAGASGGAGDADADGSVPPPMPPVGGPDASAGSSGRVENDPCTPNEGQCGDGLDCTALPAPYVGVCGRACTTDTDCSETDEVCASYLGTGASICIDLVGAWDVYEFDQTSYCDAASVPIVISDASPDLRGGLCVHVCLLPGADATTLTEDEIELLQACEAPQECAALLSTSSGAVDTVVGACATPVERGEDCGAVDAVCRNLDDDLCFPLDPANAASDVYCFQNCSDSSVTCETGSCDPVPGTDGGALCGWAELGGGE